MGLEEHAETSHLATLRTGSQVEISCDLDQFARGHRVFMAAQDFRGIRRLAWVPKSYGMIFTARCEQGAVRAKRNRIDGFFMAT